MPAADLRELSAQLEELDPTSGVIWEYDATVEDGFIAVPISDAGLQQFFSADSGSYLSELASTDPRWTVDLHWVFVDLVDAEVDRRHGLIEDPAK